MHATPDKQICFRDRIGAHTLAVMMNPPRRVVEQASQAGLVSDMLSITDATHVKAKVNTWRWKDDDENPGGKQGPDSDAKFGRKSEKKQFFGYKCSVSQDADSGIITDVEVAPGNVSDSSMFEDVADDAALAVTADKGYDSGKNFELLRERGQEAAIIPKRRRGKARYYGLAKMEFQAIMTAIAVNVKRMVTVLTGRPRWVMT